MTGIRRLCVYCGSSGAVDERHRRAAEQLGAGLAERSIELIYGGGRLGLMGLMAEAVLRGGGRVTGIIPAFLRDAEAAYQDVTELVVVDSMHARKALMAERADAFAILPGGIGTLDEMIEIISWKQLRLHDKPIILVDVAGYWQRLLALFDHLVAEGFARPQTLALMRVVPSVAALLEALLGEREGRIAVDPERL